MKHAEITNTIRKNIKDAGIKVKISRYTSCGSKWIRISVPFYEAVFAENEQRILRAIAKESGLTWVRGIEIDIEQMTNPKEMHFVVNC